MNWKCDQRRKRTAGQVRTYRLGLAQLVLGFLVLFLQHADFFVKGDELRFDVLREIFASDYPLEITNQQSRSLFSQSQEL